MSDAGSVSPTGSASGSRSGSYSRSPSPPPKSRAKHSRSRSKSSSKRYRSRSRSRSRGHRRHSRSRSPRRRRRDDRGRSHSRSPMSSRRRHLGNRDNPSGGRCLGVFNLSIYTEKRELRDVFSRYGPVEEVNVVHDRRTGRSRGFAFIYMKNEDDACEAKERASGLEIDGRKIRVDFSITERAHTPTPGIYLGKPTTGSRFYDRRSPSPYRGRGGDDRGRGYDDRRDSYREKAYRSYSRSRSRSYSPRLKMKVKIS